MTDAARLPLIPFVRMAAGPITAGLVLWAAQMSYIDPSRAGLGFGAAGVVFALAALSEFLGGAAKTDASAAAKALGRGADRVLAACALTALAYAALPVDLAVAATLYLGFETLSAALGEALSARGGVAASGLDSWKTAAVLTGVCAFLALQTAAHLRASFGIIQVLAWLSTALIWGAAALAAFSAWAPFGTALQPAQAPNQPNTAAETLPQGE